MSRRKEAPHELATANLAVATLLRLADVDLRDAAVLEAGRDPSNAPALAAQAVTRLIDTVVATEVGWRPGPNVGTLPLIPDLNPLKVPLTTLRQRLAMEPPRLPTRDGGAPSPPDRVSLREGILSAKALLKDLAARFETDLSGNGPAGSIAAVRPEPPSPLGKPPEAMSPKRAAPPHPSDAQPATTVSAFTGKGRKPRLDRPRRPIAASAAVSRPPQSVEAPPPSKPHQVEGRFAITPRAGSNSVASTSFWSLMDRWKVVDTEALQLIGHAGGLTKKGTRPRFKLSGEESEAFRGLQEIDNALVPLGLEPHEWIYHAIKETPFSGATPLAFLTQTRLTGIRTTIRFLLQNGLRMSMSPSNPRS